MYGNSNLGTTAAKIVLNEVTGANRSKLLGYFVLVNPNGITCNGAGFINIPRVTLETGIPQMDGNGNLLGLNVERDDILIEEDGLNGSNVDYFDIISRTAKITSELWANKELTIYTGRNRYDYVTRTSTAKQTTDQPIHQ